MEMNTMFSKTELSIVERASIRDMLKHISFNSEVVLNLDNTVFEPLIEAGSVESELGSDQWFSKVSLIAFDVIKNKQEAMILVLAVYHTVQHHLRMKPVEPNIVLIIKALQDIGIPVTSVTARGDVLKETTYRQLDEIEINLRGKIIFCDGKDKGTCYAAELKNRTTLPAHITAVDDKGHHLLSIAKIAESLGIRFTGIRYSHLDEKVKQLALERTHHQLAYLKPKLPMEAQLAIEVLNLVPKISRLIPQIMDNVFFTILMLLRAMINRRIAYHILELRLLGAKLLRMRSMALIIRFFWIILFLISFPKVSFIDNVFSMAC